MGRCFDQCPGNAHGDGPLCTGGCPNGTIKCGMNCLVDKDDNWCSKYIASTARHTLETVKAAASLSPSGIAYGAADLFADFAFPMCPNWGDEDFPNAKKDAAVDESQVLGASD